MFLLLFLSEINVSMETLQRHIYNPPQMSIAELLNASVYVYMFAISFFISVHTQFLKKINDAEVY